MAHLFSRVGRKSYGRMPAHEFIVLGIESSCDDTGVGIVSSRGTVLADSRHSQLPWHLKTGGIIPAVAGHLHRQNLDSIMTSALKEASIEMQDVNIVAATIGPGLPPSLRAGLDFVKCLIDKEKKPFVPIHHMEAHALTARLTHSIPFPFLVLLVSGGHCILAVCEGIGKFLRLGETTDDAPGDALDKVARTLRLQSHPLCAGLPGGKAIEILARQGDPSCFQFPHIMSKRHDCFFSFGGVKTAVTRLVKSQEVDRLPYIDSPVQFCEDISASFQFAVCRHLITRTERAILYCLKNWPNLNHLVVSGGVASNLFLRKRLSELCLHYKYQLTCPTPSLCTDNGVMIAWAGVEHMLAGHSLLTDLSSLEFKSRWPLGKDISNAVMEQRIKVKRRH